VHSRYPFRNTQPTHTNIFLWYWYYITLSIPKCFNPQGIIFRDWISNGVLLIDWYIYLFTFLFIYLLAIGFKPLPSRWTWALKTRLLFPIIRYQFREALFIWWSSRRPQISVLNVLWIRGKGTQMYLFEWSQNFTLTENVGRCFILCCTPPA
jgi:hypothetical protein